MKLIKKYFIILLSILTVTGACSCVAAAAESDDINNKIVGDVDGDKEATILDATYIQRFATKVNVPYTSADMIRGDIDGDEEVTVIDASFVQRSATRVYVPYPVGETV